MLVYFYSSKLIISFYDYLLAYADLDGKLENLICLSSNLLSESIGFLFFNLPFSYNCNCSFLIFSLVYLSISSGSTSSSPSNLDVVVFSSYFLVSFLSQSSSESSSPFSVLIIIQIVIT